MSESGESVRDLTEVVYQGGLFYVFDDTREAFDDDDGRSGVAGRVASRRLWRM